MKKRLLYVCLLPCLVFAATWKVYQQKKPAPPASKSYQLQWKEIDQSIGNGLTETALKKVMELYVRAKKESKIDQQMKAIIYRGGLIAENGEDYEKKEIYFLQQELKEAKTSLSPLLHSYLAERYWNYFQQNRWRFYDRSETKDFNSDSIDTWSLDQLLEATYQHYKLSVKNVDSLQKVSIGQWDLVLLKKKDTRALRPTLYDFLAHRAIDFFSNDEGRVHKAAEQFSLDNAAYFSSSEQFNKIQLHTPDSLAAKYHALYYLQQLSLFHAKDKTLDALADVELKRINFVYDNMHTSNKDSLYLDALNRMEKQFASSPVSAEIIYNKAFYYTLKGDRWTTTATDSSSRWMKKEALTTAMKAIRRFPKSFGAKACQGLIDEINKKQFNITLNEVSPVNTDFPYLLNYKNIAKLYTRVVAMDKEAYATLQNEGRGEESKMIKKLLALNTISKSTQKLPLDGDFQMHAVEVKQSGLPYGHYILLLSDDSTFNVGKSMIIHQSFVVSTIAFTYQHTAQGTQVVVVNRSNGKAMPGVGVKLWSTSYNHKTRTRERENIPGFVTDQYGKVMLPVSDKNDYRNLDVEFSQTIQQAGKTITVDKLNWEGVYIPRYDVPSDGEVYHSSIFTDRAIYRPGQVVYFKGICMKKVNGVSQIYPKVHVLVDMYDANYQKIHSQSFYTNEYGSYSGSFVLPVGGMNGWFRIKDSFGEHGFSVEEYKRPKFEVTIPPAKDAYKLNEQVRIHGMAKTYSGIGVDGAKVKYEVVRTTWRPYWCRYWWPGRGESRTTIATAEIQSNDTGGFVIDFKAIPDLSEDPNATPVFNYEVSVSVTDLNGETQSTTTNVQVGYASAKLEVPLQEELFIEGLKDMSIHTTNLNGQEIGLKGTVKVYRLQSPSRVMREKLWAAPDKKVFTPEQYVDAFPYDAYAQENDKMTWKKGEKVLDVGFDTGKEKELKNTGWNSWPVGAYVMEAVAKDPYGVEVKDIRYFTLLSSTQKVLPYPTTHLFKGMKTTGEPGETAQVLVGTSYPDAHILCQVEHKGKTIREEWLTLNNEQRLLEFPITEEQRGNFFVHIIMVAQNRYYEENFTIEVPFSNKELKIETETFRNKLLPGEKEEWKLKISGSKGEKVAAELLASMYDASLDAFQRHSFQFNIYNSAYAVLNWNAVLFGTYSSYNSYYEYWSRSLLTKEYEQLMSYYEFRENSYSKTSFKNEESVVYENVGSVGDAGAVPSRAPDESGTYKTGGKTKRILSESDERVSTGGQELEKPADLSQLPARKNFNETAFFFPQLQTNEKGEVILQFTIPESLTRWKLLGLAHTKELSYGFLEKEVQTQKPLMVIPNAPRFLREGDQVEFTAKISNLSDSSILGNAELFLFDAITMQPLTPAQLLFETVNAKASFSSAAHQSSVVKWKFKIPRGINAITYRVAAKAGNFTDAEEMTLPVLSNTMLVTEAMPLLVRGTAPQNFTFDKLLQANFPAGGEARHHKLTLEYTSNPAWYAIQSLPYLMEYPYECAEQVFSRYYANSIASHIANSNPAIKNVFDMWSAGGNASALLSNLENNQELKNALLEETPWVMDAKNESERKKRVALLFDLNKMSNELNSAVNKLKLMQSGNGGFPWFSGMPDDRYITQHIIAGLGHLNKLGIDLAQNSSVNEMVENAVQYMDQRIAEDYELLKKQKEVKLEEHHLDYIHIHYLYARSFFSQQSVDKKVEKAYNYYKEQARKYWMKHGRYLQGMIALQAQRSDEKQLAQDILKSLKENAIVNPQLGMYWKENTGYYWYQAPIETQALLIEAFAEISHDDKAINDMKVWLLTNKQTNSWSTTKATAEACYALLLRGENWLQTSAKVQIKLGKEKVDPVQSTSLKEEAGSGYFKTSWQGTEVKPDMGKITVYPNGEGNTQTSDKGLQWGAVYWQYFQELDKITPHETPLKLSKKLFVERSTTSGPVIEPVTGQTQLNVGDKIIVRIELRSDRDMEYVHMKDMRASGFEPMNVFSQYKYRDGLGYYESTKDAATNFFFSYLPKGTYVFEYPLRVTHKGNFSNGITTIQSMYAPEFTSHSEGVRVEVK